MDQEFGKRFYYLTRFLFLIPLGTVLDSLTFLKYHFVHDSIHTFYVPPEFLQSHNRTFLPSAISTFHTFVIRLRHLKSVTGSDHDGDGFL